MKIFVTVGTADMDELICAVDEQISVGFISDSVVAQIGRGRYTPKHMGFFPIATPETMQRGIDWADLVISTGGAATISDVIIKRNKKLIVVNMRPWSPQALKPFIDGNHALYCEDLEDLHLVIHKAKTFEFVPFETEQLDFRSLLEEFDIDPNRIHPIEKFCLGMFFLFGLLLILTGLLS